MSEPSPSDVGRRDVLRFGAAAAGGLLVQIAVPGCAPPRFGGVRGGVFVPNAWLIISPDDRVTFVLDRVEMGQGTTTSHAQMVAEELEIDPARLVIATAPAGRAYDNPDPLLLMQVTGGSTSVRTSYEPLRAAAATTRELLKAAAARRWGVAVTSCVADNGAITHPSSGRTARYGELAIAAANERVAVPALKPASAFKWIGKSVPRLDAPAKVDGSTIYGIDVKLPGLLTAVILRAPAIGAKLKGFDGSAALREPGVSHVLAVPTGVAVVASSYWRARRASALVKVEWTEGAIALDTERLRAAFHARLREPGKVLRADGSVARAEGEAATVLEAIYETPYLAHATLEPQNATAIVKDGRCEVWAPSQSFGLAREGIRRLTGFAYHDIVMHQTAIGGGYGRRLAQDYVLEAVTIALRIKKPVKIVWSREDDTTHDVYRPMSVTQMRAGLSRDGTLTSWFERMACQSIIGQIAEEWGQSIVPNSLPLAMKSLAARGAATLYSGGAITDPSSLEGGRDIAYAIPNIEAEFAAINVSVPVGWWRSIGTSNNVFAVEAFFDEVARAAKKDPFEMRRDLLAHAPRARRVLELAAEKAGWTTALKPGVARGIAQTTVFGTSIAQVAEVTVEGRHVRCHRVVVAVDCGKVINPDLVRAQIEGGVGFGLGAAMSQEITLAKGRVEQSNFHDYPSLRMHEMPVVEVHIVPSEEPPTGIGEPGVPLVAPTIANAILRATGRPVRRLPIRRAMEEAK